MINLNSHVFQQLYDWLTDGCVSFPPVLWQTDTDRWVWLQHVLPRLTAFGLMSSFIMVTQRHGRRVSGKPFVNSENQLNGSQMMLVRYGLSIISNESNTTDFLHCQFFFLYLLHSTWNSVWMCFKQNVLNEALILG